MATFRVDLHVQGHALLILIDAATESDVREQLRADYASGMRCEYAQPDGRRTIVVWSNVSFTEPAAISLYTLE